LWAYFFLRLLSLIYFPFNFAMSLQIKYYFGDVCQLPI